MRLLPAVERITISLPLAIFPRYLLALRRQQVPPVFDEKIFRIKQHEKRNKEEKEEKQ